MSPFQPFKGMFAHRFATFAFPPKTAHAIESVTFNFGFQGNVDGVPAMQISRIQRGPQVTDFLIPIVLSEALQTVG